MVNTKKQITNSTLINISNTLQDYSTKRLPQKISYAITKNIMIVAREYDVYDKELHKIFDRYKDHMVMEKPEGDDGGDSNGEGTPKTDAMGIPIVDESVTTEFRNQIFELLNMQIEVEFYTIPEEVFDYEDKGIYDPLSAKDIIKLQGILMVKEEPKDEDEASEEKDE